MQALRTSRHLTRLVLVWFVLFVGASVASALVHPQISQLICSADGHFKIVADQDEGNTAVHSHGMDCPLCMPVAHSAPLLTYKFVSPSGLSHVLQSSIGRQTASTSFSPLSARGPPVPS